MSTSRIPAVKAALVSTFTAAFPSMTVIYGPFVTVPDGDYMCVGWSPELDRATGTQIWKGMGNKARQEQFDIPCYCDSFSGETDAQARDQAAYDMLAAAEGVLRADPSLGGVIPTPGLAEMGSYHDIPEQSDQGLAVGLVFHVTGWTRI